MKLFYLSILLFLFSFNANAQIVDSVVLFKSNDTVQIKYCIQRFFEGLEGQDTVKLKEAMYADLTLKTIIENIAEKKERFIIESREELIQIVAKKRTATFDEKLLSMHIFIDGRLASVWTPYEFYINGQPSHRGANSFQLVKTNKGWQIFSIVDTRHR